MRGEWRRQRQGKDRSQEQRFRFSPALCNHLMRTRVATILPNCYRTRRGFHLRRLQVTLSLFAFPGRTALSAAKGLRVNSAKMGARVGGVHEMARPGGIFADNARSRGNHLNHFKEDLTRS